MHQVNIIEKFFFFHKLKIELGFSLSFLVRQQETSVDRRKKILVKQNANINHHRNRGGRGTCKGTCWSITCFFAHFNHVFPQEFSACFFFFTLKKQQVTRKKTLVKNKKIKKHFFSMKQKLKAKELFPF